MEGKSQEEAAKSQEGARIEEYDPNSTFYLKIKLIANPKKARKDVRCFNIEKVLDSVLISYEDLVRSIVDKYPPGYLEVPHVQYYDDALKTFPEVKCDQDLMSMFEKHQKAKVVYMFVAYCDPSEMYEPITEWIFEEHEQANMNTEEMEDDSYLRNPLPENEFVGVDEEGMYLQIVPTENMVVCLNKGKDMAGDGDGGGDGHEDGDVDGEGDVAGDGAEFGPVYRGAVGEALRPGLRAQDVAIKYLDLEGGTQGHKEWLAEVFFLGQLRHKNLVKLIGYCYEAEHRMLVYEFMSFGSLENHLFKSVNGALPWMTRMKIAVGAAKGLAFLHDADPPVIYRDFKASNILLDSDYNTKLSDFGLAKDGPQGDETHVTTRVMGTHGYAAPEYILTGHLTAKSDVYSFGVVLLELLAGRQSVDRSRRTREQNLVDWARPYLKHPDRLYKVMDPALECQYSCRGAEVAAIVAYKCLSQNPKSRPTMREVVRALEPVLGMDDDFFPAGPFVFTISVEEDKVVGVKVEVEEHHQSHQDRHRQKYPNSSIHAGIVLHSREGMVGGDYTAALRRQRRASSHHKERGA